MSDPSKGFLADISANVEDDTPRLVYADWLEDHGQPERAELIRVQIERTRLPRWDAAQVRLRLREEALLVDHAEGWRAELPKMAGVWWGNFWRGFVGEASLDSFTLLRDPAWREAAPVEAIKVKWPKKGEADGLEAIPGLRELAMAGRMVSTADADRLSACRILSTLRVLNLTGCAVGVGGLERIVSSPYLGRLEALRAADNGIGDGIVEALSAGPADLPALEELDLSESGDAGYYGEEVFTPEGMAGLGVWPGMARIRRLDLSGHDFRGGQLQALLGRPLAVGLKELTFVNNHNYEGFGAILEAARPGLDLDFLDITGGNDRGDAHRLAANPALRNLKVLHVHGVFNEEESDGIRALMSAPFMASLHALHFEMATADESGFEPLTAAATPRLHTLSLHHVDFLDQHFADFAASPWTDALLDLDLRNNGLAMDSAKALGDSKHLRSLLVLRVGGNPMGKKGEDAIAASPLGRRLMLLDRSER